MTSQNINTDWQSGKSFSETNLYMLESEVACDVTFRVGTEQTTVHCHKFMLISRSHVFAAMLCGPLAETGEIKIPDVTVEIFKLCLRFLLLSFTRTHTRRWHAHKFKIIIVLSFNNYPYNTNQQIL